MDDNTYKAYKALDKACTRLNQLEYLRQVRKNKGKRLKTFYPHYQSQTIIDTQKSLCNGSTTPEEAMAILWDPTMRAEINEAIDAGY